MVDRTDKPPEEQDRETERQTIRAVLAAVQAEQRAEIKAQQFEIVQKKREAKEKRIKTRREKDQKTTREAQARRVKAFRESNEQVATHVAAASRALRAARRAATQIPFPRHSPEAREAQRTARSLESALGALRQVGRGTFYESDVDMDLNSTVDAD